MDATRNRRQLMTTHRVPHTREANAARRAQVVELTRAGHSAAEIAVILGITERRVTSHRSEAGIAQPPRDPLTADQLARAAELLDDGCSYNEVARTIGCGYSVIRRRFPGRGWPPGKAASLMQFERRALRQITAHTGAA